MTILARKKTSKKSDPFGFGSFDFGLGSGSDVFGQRKSKKQRKRDQLAENRETGMQKQRFDEMMYRMQGYDVKRRRTGCDFEATRPNFFTGKKEHLYVESKSSKTAPMRPLQKKMKKKKGKNYVVERGGSLI